MAEPSADARIRDLERRLDMDPGSRLFVSLAEEYRKLGRFRQALSALQKGLLAHPGYIAAQVALGRVYLEASQKTDAIATFTKVLVADPGNLVAAKSLGDVYLSRGDSLEALKKYKLYRALSGDKTVDEVLAALEAEVAPRPVTPSKVVAKVEPPSPPPPPSFQVTDSRRRSLSSRIPSNTPAPGLPDAFDITSVAFEPGEDSGTSAAEDPFPFVPNRDTPLATPPPRQQPLAEPAPLWRPEEHEAVPEATVAAAAAHPVAAPPTGRALADLYYSQGHYADALQIYDDLVTRNPFDEDLMRKRRDSEARLLPAESGASAPTPDPAVDRRRARIRTLQRWLSRVQAG
ncbi:MAG: tetratricopeptide repeat protein [Acidobacteriota bacterium]